MIKIAVTGGKGGTGKSTFSVLHSLKLAEKSKVVLCDADVECPNDHLLLGAKLEKQENIFGEYPKLDESKCLKCGECSRICRQNAIFWVKGKNPVFVENVCNACGACIIACKQKAIGTKKKQTGEIFRSKINENLWLVSGLSNPQTIETSGIVQKTREFAEKFAKKIGADFLVIDSAAGMHCPVVSAVINSDKCFAVTEPTPLGEHDLALILELLEKLGLKTEVIINKANVGKKALIERIAKKFGVKIAKEIPYSKKIIQAYSTGKIKKLEGLL
ncbi:MAG: P-loop NTPase [Candidatus Diapherotrites archaeon]|nr:P-loop NTPase [Candidatus Diapherotrites archaeon]